ncbi:ribosome recycling factor [Rubellicoccus peritrichatus]|uniref:Ribosome-recycling factor n=1 Tax=Rubellicoccus peritrichatus TaxID=3080537 RepID=A0AAQ3QU15_9BACT|nr:ribosome recycling factor [Puniceicoccus sp. CR14]WOO39993.1 ribosome recycling factor [Puniceicoccus sp. CR14]
MEPDQVVKKARADMQKALEHTLHELNSIHTGKASPSMVESIPVNAYGSSMQMKEVAAITTPDARTIQIEPWDKGLLQEVEKGIQTANIGINPTVRGSTIFCPLPELSGDRRKDLIKISHGMGEQGRVGVRAARRDAMDAIKQLVKDKAISEDDQKRLEKEVQSETDSFVAEIEQHLKAKEAELLQV